MFFKCLSIILFSLTIFSSTKGQSSERPDCHTFWQREEITPDYDYKEHANFTFDGNLGYDDWFRPLRRSECQKEWALLIYMAADNDLSPYALWDMSEMERFVPGARNLGASNSEGDFLVELDTWFRTGVRRYHVFQARAPYDPSDTLDHYETFAETSLLSPMVTRFSEDGEYASLPQTQRFSRYLDWAMKNYPAKKYIVVIWGHGRGYEGKHDDKTNKSRPIELKEEFTYESDLLKKSEINLAGLSPVASQAQGRSSLAWDASEKSGLTIPELKSILKQKRQSFGHEKYAAIAFDACLMQTLEVASSLKEETDYLLGSVQVQNYLGLPYRSIIDELIADGDTWNLVKQIPSLVEESYGPEGHQGAGEEQRHRTMTFSALQLAEMDQFLTPSLIELSRDLKTWLSHDRKRKLELRFLLEFGFSFRGGLRDLGIFLGTLKKLLFHEQQRLGADRDLLKLRATIDQTWDHLNRVLIDYRYGPLYSTEATDPSVEELLGFFRGVSLWIPSNRRMYEDRIREMQTSELFLSKDEEGHGWNDWMEELFSQVL